MTPEQAFEKWWSSSIPTPSEAMKPGFQIRQLNQAFLAGKQYQATNQLMVLADIRKAVGDGEGRLTQEELVERIRCLVRVTQELQDTAHRSMIMMANLSSAVSAATEKEEA